MPRAEVRAGDCLGLLEAIDYADTIITDPPYCSGGFSESARRQARGQGLRSETLKRDGWFVADNMGTAGLAWIMREVALRALRILPDGGTMAIFTDWRQVPNLEPVIESAGFRWSNLIVWDKGHAGLGEGFRARHELALLFTKGPARYYSADHGNVLPASRVKTADRMHQAEKPLELLRPMIRTLAPPDGLVLDPFTGSAAVGIAALCEGRRFLGLELDPDTAAAARARVEAFERDPLAGDKADPEQIGLFGGA